VACDVRVVGIIIFKSVKCWNRKWKIALESFCISLGIIILNITFKVVITIYKNLTVFS